MNFEKLGDWKTYQKSGDEQISSLFSKMRETIFENTFRLWVRGSQHFNENNIKLSRCSEFFLHYLRAFLKVLSREVTTGCGLGARSDV